MKKTSKTKGNKRKVDSKKYLREQLLTIQDFKRKLAAPIE